MAYNATYNAGDVSEVTIDGIVGIFAAIASLATLVGLVLLYKFMKSRF